MKKDIVEQILKDRGKTNGDFIEVSEVAQDLKRVMVNSNGWSRLHDDHRECLDLIATKIGRILAGDPTYDDHWHDIAGYARLANRKSNGKT